MKAHNPTIATALTDLSSNGVLALRHAAIIPGNLTADEYECFEERAAIMEFDCGLDRAKAELKALALVLGKRPELSGEAALTYMTANGIKLIGRYPSAAAIAKGDDYERAFTCDYAEIANLMEGRGDREGRAKGTNIVRFDWRPSDYGFLALDIDRGHGDGIDGVESLYNVMHGAGKPRTLLPRYLQDIAGGSHPCWTATPSGGLHLYFRHTGKLAIKTVVTRGVEVKAGRLTITAPGSEKNGRPYVLHRGFAHAPDLPPFLVKLIEKPKPKPVYTHYEPMAVRGETPLSLIAQWTECDYPSEGRNTFANRFSAKAARQGYSQADALSFLKSYPRTATLPERELKTAVASAYRYGRAA